MKGRLEKKVSGWHVSYTECHPRMMVKQFNKSIPLSPEDVPTNPFHMIGEYGEVDFEIEEYWETGLEEVIKVAKLIK